jgi:hypothetical protein
MTGVASRLRFAEITSSIGAGIIGVGIGVLLASRIGKLAIPTLMLGALLHAWGMFDKHRIERSSSATDPWWSRALCWVCWVALLATALYVGLGR